MKPGTVRILAVEDNPADYRIIEEYLKGQSVPAFEVTQAATMKKALDLLAAGTYGVILLDLNLPDSTGFDGLDRVVAANPLSPVIVLTGLDDEEMGVRALSRRADDFLIKGKINEDILVRSIRYAIERGKLNEEMRRLNADLQKANESLESSRLAAVNLMEDAVESRRQAVNDRNLLDAVLDALPVGVAIMDREGGNIQSNPKFDEIWGSTRPEVRSISDYGAFAAWFTDTGMKVAPEEWASSRAVTEGETIIGQSIRIRKFNGDEAYILNSAAPIFDSGGSIVGSAVTIEDITPLRRAEMELRKSAERFELLSMTAGELLRSKDPRGIIERLCRRVMEILDCQAFFNFMADKSAGKLRLNAYAGIPESEALAITWLDYGSAVCGCAARDRCRIVAEHIPTTPDERTDLVRSYGITAYACHPMLGEDESIIGTLSFGTKTRETFSEDDLSLMKAVADQVAVAMVRIQDEETLRRNERMLQSIMDATKESIWLFDTQGITLKANRTALERIGKTAEEAIGRPFTEFIPGHLIEPRMARFKKTVDTGLTVDFEDERDGIVFHNSYYPVQGENNAVTQVVLYARDITERKKNERKLKQLNRALMALSKSSKAMVCATDETSYLNAVCRIIVEDCGHSMVWIGYAEHNEEKTVRPAAFAGFESGYIDTLRITWADTERGRGPTGTAIRTGKPSLCRNMLTDTDFLPWRDEAMKRGYTSSVVLPLMYGDAALGALNIYSTEQDPFSGDEVQLLMELADDLAQGIMTIRLQEAHAKSEELLRQSEERHRALFETIRHGVVYQNADGTITAANPAAQRILGLSLAQMQGRTTINPQWQAIHEDGSPFTEESHPSMVALRTGQLVHNVVMGIFKASTGAHTWISINAIPQFRPGEDTPYQVYTTFEDITERKNNEKSIRHLASFPEINPHPIVEVDAQGAVIYFNASARALFPGLQFQGMSHPFLSALRPDDQRLIDNPGTVQSAEITIGQSIFRQYHHYLEEEKCFRIYGFDITEAKRAENAMKESEKRFRALFESMTEGVVIHEMIVDDSGAYRDYRIINANPAMERHTGLKPSDAIGQLGSALYKTDPAPYLDAYGRVVASGESAVFDTYFPPMDRYFSISAFALAAGQFVTVFEDITDKALAEEDMRQTLAATTDGIWKRNAKTGEMYFSPRYYTMLGYEPDEFPPSLEAWKGLIHPDDFERALRVHDDFEIADRDMYLNEFRMRTKDGSYRLIRSRGRVVKRDENGARVKIIGNHDDVTDERAAEQLLEDTNKLLTTIVDNTDLLIAYVDSDFNYILVNRSYAEASGNPISFFPGKNLLDMAAADGIGEQFRNVVQTGTPLIEKGRETVYPMKAKDGGRYCDLSIIPIQGAAGSVKGLVVTLADVTDYKIQEANLLKFNERLDLMVRKRTEQLSRSNKGLVEEIARTSRLESEKEKALAELDTIFNSTSVGMAVIDLDFNFIRVNRRFSEMVSKPPEEIIGKKCFELWQGATCRTEFCPIMKILSGEARIECEYEMGYTDADGRELLLQMSIVPYYAGDDSVAGIISNVIDITEKREIEMKLTNIVDEERKNISYELHDDVGQNLTAIGFILESIRQKAAGPRTTVISKLDEAGELLLTAQNKTRSLSKLLSPVDMTKGGFRASMEMMASLFERVYGIRCLFMIDDAFEITDSNTATTLYYIAREAMTNAAKHGKPKTVTIRAVRDETSLGIIISDDGSGITDAKIGPGIGMKIMKYRATIIGASFAAGNGPGGGFIVTVRLPW